MTRSKLTRLALAASFLGLTSFANGTNAPLQDPEIRVDVKNGNAYPIRVKRVGIADNDVATADIEGLGSFPFTDIPLQGDQGFTAWTAEGRLIGSQTVTLATLTGPHHAALGVGPLSVSIELRPKGLPRNEAQALGGRIAGEVHAPNLGITYTQVRYNNGTFGARLSRAPAPGSPAAALQLEPGDTIVTLDDLAFRIPDDVLRHYGQTSMIFVNVRTGQPQAANLILPPQ